jgi:hypothetical protein
MKKILAIIAVALCIGTTTTAQSFVEDNYADLLSRDDATVVNVSGKLFQMMSKFEEAADEEEAQEVLRMMDNIDAFTLVKVDSDANSMELFKRGKSLISDLEELVRVKDKGVNVVISVDETNDVVHEIVALIAMPEEQGFVAASLEGRIDLDDVSKMVAKFQDQAMPMLNERASSVDLDAVRVFPNPVQGGSVMTLEVDESLLGGSAAVMDMSGKVINTYPLNGVITSIETNNLAGGQHFIEVISGDTSYKRKFIVIR